MITTEPIVSQVAAAAAQGASASGEAATRTTLSGVEIKAKGASTGVVESVDAAVRRATSLHFSTLSKSEVAELRVGEESLFNYARREWVQKRASRNNLPAGWWDQTRQKMQGLPQTDEIPIVDPTQSVDSGIRAGLEQIQHKNPALRKCVKLDHHLRSLVRKVNQHEMALILNEFAACYRRNCKFVCDLGVCIARYLAKHDLKDQFAKEVFYIFEIYNNYLAYVDFYIQLCFRL